MFVKDPVKDPKTLGLYWPLFLFENPSEVV